MRRAGIGLTVVGGGKGGHSLGELLCGLDSPEGAGWKSGQETAQGKQGHTIRGEKEGRRRSDLKLETIANLPWRGHRPIG